MFAHVTIRATDRAASERFYRTVLGEVGVVPSHESDEIVAWDDFAILESDLEHSPTRNLHVAFVAPSREHVQAFWQAGIEAGYADDGAPGERRQYRSDYYGGRWEQGVQFRGAWATFSLIHDGRPSTEGLHIAFPAPDRQTVDDFHRAAVAAGYTSDGEPGERPWYASGYYAAYVLDPDGTNVESMHLKSLK